MERDLNTTKIYFPSWNERKQQDEEKTMVGKPTKKNETQPQSTCCQIQTATTILLSCFFLSLNPLFFLSNLHILGEGLGTTATLHLEIILQDILVKLCTKGKLVTRQEEI